jgi:hypothetical protein
MTVIKYLKPIAALEILLGQLSSLWTDVASSVTGHLPFSLYKDPPMNELEFWNEPEPPKYTCLQELVLRLFTESKLLSKFGVLLFEWEMFNKSPRNCFIRTVLRRERSLFLRRWGLTFFCCCWVHLKMS